MGLPLETEADKGSMHSYVFAPSMPFTAVLA